MNLRPLTPSSFPRRWRVSPGMTLIELTVVIGVLLSLVIILYIGARAWKEGSDRAGCVLQIRQVQVAVRSYSNLSGREAGDDVSPLVLKDEIIGSGSFVELPPSCPGGGAYTLGDNVIPEIGTLYMSCSLSSDEKHVPDYYADW